MFVFDMLVLAPISQTHTLFFVGLESKELGVIGSNSELMNMLRIKNIKNK